MEDWRKLEDGGVYCQQSGKSATSFFMVGAARRCGAGRALDSRGGIVYEKLDTRMFKGKLRIIQHIYVQQARSHSKIV